MRLEFTLAAPQRLFLIVRGPAPSCRVAGVIPFRGRKGKNVARFAGRIQGRVLKPGTYLLTLSPTRRLTDARPTEQLRVVSDRRTVPLPDKARKLSCSIEQEQTLAATAMETARFFQAETPTVRAPATPIVTLATLPPPQAALPEIGDDEGLLGTRIPNLLSPDASNVTETAAAIAILLIVGGLLVAMLTLVTRFLRGTWSP